jgi:hypothetical protein
MASGCSLGSFGPPEKFKFLAVEVDTRALSVGSKVADCNAAVVSGYFPFLFCLPYAAAGFAGGGVAYWWVVLTLVSNW